MSESNDVLMDGVRIVRDHFQKARAAKSLEQSFGFDSEKRDYFRRLKRSYYARTVGATIGLLLSLPLYALCRTMELIGVLPVLFLIGSGIGLAIWTAIGDRASATEFVGFVVGGGLVLIPCAFIWALNMEENDSE